MPTLKPRRYPRSGPKREPSEASPDVPLSAPDDVMLLSSSNEAGHAGIVLPRRVAAVETRSKRVKIKREMPAEPKPNKTNERKKLPRQCKHIGGSQNKKDDTSTNSTAKIAKTAQEISPPDAREEPSDGSLQGAGDMPNEDTYKKEAIEARKPFFWRRATEDDIRELCHKADITYISPPENHFETIEEKRKRVQSMKYYLKLARKGTSNKDREASLAEFLRDRMKYNQTEIGAILPFMSKKLLLKKGVNKNVLHDMATLFYCAYVQGMDLAKVQFD